MKNTCLIAESDPFVAKLLKKFAQLSGFLTHQCQTGLATVEFIKKNQPQLVILDPDLPGKFRGWEVAEWLGTSSKTSSIPIIFCYWPGKSESITTDAKNQSYLHKPDILFPDFLKALSEAGIQVSDGCDDGETLTT